MVRLVLRVSADFFDRYIDIKFTFTYIQIYIYTYTQIHIYTYIFTFIDIYIYTSVHLYIYKSIHINTSIHRYIDT